MIRLEKRRLTRMAEGLGVSPGDLIEGDAQDVLEDKLPFSNHTVLQGGRLREVYYFALCAADSHTLVEVSVTENMT